MNRSFEQEYREMMNKQTPDLWDRIEAGVKASDRSNSVITGIDDLRKETEIIKEKKLLFPIICIAHSILFIAFGILGFFVPEEYSFIPILAILAFVITLIVFFLTVGKKEKE